MAKTLGGWAIIKLLGGWEGGQLFQGGGSPETKGGYVRGRMCGREAALQPDLQLKVPSNHAVIALLGCKRSS